MKYTFKEISCYIPEIYGNKKRPESEQIKIYWRYPTAEEVREIRKRTNPKVNFKDGKVVADGIEIEIIVDDLLAVKKLVTTIENLEVNGQQIKDGEILLKTPGMNGVVQEISTEILSQMDKVRTVSKN